MRKTFDLTLDINGQERKFALTPSYKAIGEIESHELHPDGKGSLQEMLVRIYSKSLRMADYVAVIHGCIRATGDRDITVDEIGEAIADAGLLTFHALVTGIVFEALGMTEKNVAKASRKKATEKK